MCKKKFSYTNFQKKISLPWESGKVGESSRGGGVGVVEVSSSVVVVVVVAVAVVVSLIFSFQPKQINEW